MSNKGVEQRSVAKAATPEAWSLRNKKVRTKWLSATTIPDPCGQRLRGPCDRAKSRIRAKRSQEIRYISTGAVGWTTWKHRTKGNRVPAMKSLEPKLDRLICIYIASNVFQANRIALERRRRGPLLSVLCAEEDGQKSLELTTMPP